MLLRLAAGLVSGAIGTAAMDASQSTVIPAVGSWVQSLRSGNGSNEGEPSDESGGGEQQSQGASEESLSAPEKVAKRGAGVLGIELDREQVALWGNRVHWLQGLQLGIPYQLLRSQPGVRSGLVYGAALWLLTDELMLWAIGIAKSPASYPPKTHLDALAAHCVYGAVVGIAAKGLSRT